MERASRVIYIWEEIYTYVSDTKIEADFSFIEYRCYLTFMRS